MNGNYWKVQSTHSSKILLLLFSLLASICLTPSEFIDCQSLFPDENLDFLAIAGGSQKQSPAPSVSTPIASPANPRHSWSHHFEICLPQLINSRTALTTILRC
jgi:hypothetical protein